MTFQQLGLKQELLDAVLSLGFENPMPIQEQVIPFVLENHNDLVALAQTGTGKTAAFGLPILNLIDVSKQCVQALILAPTRELCVQIANDMKSYASYMKNTKIVPVYGGESIINQYKQLDIQPQVLVATPGRLIDLISRGKVDLSNVNFLVLDEADEMLNMGFKDDIETILSAIPNSRRTMLFSATMPNEIASIAKKYMGDFHEIAVGSKNSASDNVDHIYYMVNAANRYLALKRIVDMNPNIYAIVFCRTRQETKEVAEHLMRDGYNADALHGDLSQEQRDTVMNKFRIKHIQVLVATDVAARGLDVSELTHVINYNLPDDAEVYTHRSGRTGRAGKKGVSCVIIHTREGRKLREIERIIQKEFRREKVPTGMDVCKRQLFHLIDKMERVDVDNEQISQFMEQIFAKLSYLTREELILRFVSLEFNRFLDYYRDSEDINVDVKLTKRGDNDEQVSRRKKNGGKRVRLKMLYGSKQNATPKSVLSLINSITHDKSISIGDIEITNKYTFFDVYADQCEQVLKAFEAEDTPLTVAEPKEVVSHAPRYNKKGDRASKTRYERGGSSVNPIGSKSVNKDKAWAKMMDQPDKPWRNRRR